MKPSKTENEVESTMKSITKYVFVPPGAIRKGQGRGRGPRSLVEKENMPIKSLFPQSSDLVKQYIQTIETMGRDEDKGLKTLPYLLVKDQERYIKTLSFLRKSICKLIFHCLHQLIKLSNTPKKLKQGEKDCNPPDLATIFFETRKKNNKLVEPEEIEKHAQIEEIVQADPSLPSIEIVEKCCRPQTRSHVFGFGGGVKAKDLKGETSSKAELLSALRSTREENKYLNEENKSLNERLSTLEDEMKEVRKMREFFAAQESHVPLTTTSPVSTE